MGKHIILIVLLSFSCFILFIAIGRKNHTTLFYEGVIKNTSKCDSTIFPDILLDSHDFIEISQNPTYYKDSCQIFLKNKVHSKIEKMTAILSMYNLDIDNYMYIANEAFQLYKIGDIDSFTMSFILACPFLNNSPVYRNHKNIKAVKFLNGLILEPQTPKMIKELATSFVNN